MRIINKFGGEIVGSPRLVKLAVKRLKEQIKKNQKPVVVVSALVGVTDKLVKLSQNYAQKIIEELDKQHCDWAEQLKINNQGFKKDVQNLRQKLENDLRELKRNKDKLALQDRILSYGEKWSSLFFTELLIKNGIQSKRLTGEELGIITDENFGDANIKQKESLKNIKAKLKNISWLPVITGFIGKTSEGKTTTLGRGGSDTTACLVGAMLNPSKVILWKNVPGVLSSDPKIVRNAKTIKFLTYDEAEESGKVIHNKAIDLIRGKNVMLEVTCITNPGKKTIITDKIFSRKGVKIISSKNNLFLLTILTVKKGEMSRPGILYKITKVINEGGINMVLIRNTKESIYITIEKNKHNLTDCIRKIRGLGCDVSAKEVSMVNAVGRMDWEASEKFNRLLYKICPESDLGAFPYKNCLLLQAIIEPSKVEKLIKIFYKEFIGSEKNSPR